MDLMHKNLVVCLGFFSLTKTTTTKTGQQLNFPVEVDLLCSLLNSICELSQVLSHL